LKCIFTKHSQGILGVNTLSSAPCSYHDSPLGSFSKTVRLWDSWFPQLDNISQIPKPHHFRKTTLNSVSVSAPMVYSSSSNAMLLVCTKRLNLYIVALTVRNQQQRM
jgi:hypothetical protein